MPALATLLWAFCLFIWFLFMDDWFRRMGLTMMFPEGKRWWHRLVSLALFASFSVLVLCNPWNGPWFYYKEFGMK